MRDFLVGLPYLYGKRMGKSMFRERNEEHILESPKSVLFNKKWQKQSDWFAWNRFFCQRNQQTVKQPLQYFAVCISPAKIAALSLKIVCRQKRDLTMKQKGRSWGYFGGSNTIFSNCSQSWSWRKSEYRLGLWGILVNRVLTNSSHGIHASMDKRDLTNKKYIGFNQSQVGLKYAIKLYEMKQPAGSLPWFYPWFFLSTNVDPSFSSVGKNWMTYFPLKNNHQLKWCRSEVVIIQPVWWLMQFSQQNGWVEGNNSWITNLFWVNYTLGDFESWPTTTESHSPVYWTIHQLFWRVERVGQEMSKNSGVS